MKAGNMTKNIIFLIFSFFCIQQINATESKTPSTENSTWASLLPSKAYFATNAVLLTALYTEIKTIYKDDPLAAAVSIKDPTTIINFVQHAMAKPEEHRVFLATLTGLGIFNSMHATTIDSRKVNGIFNKLMGYASVSYLTLLETYYTLKPITDYVPRLDELKDKLEMKIKNALIPDFLQTQEAKEPLVTHLQRQHQGNIQALQNLKEHLDRIEDKINRLLRNSLLAPRTQENNRIQIEDIN